jgi:hypothetical protein
MRWNDRISLIVVAFGISGCATQALGGPPDGLLQDCGTVPTKPRTNGELAKQREALIADIKACNRDKALLREWAERKQ